MASSDVDALVVKARISITEALFKLTGITPPRTGDTVEAVDTDEPAPPTSSVRHARTIHLKH